ncbi:hypothetical protein Tco_1303065 [Tanacetum coccineum]
MIRVLVTIKILFLTNLHIILQVSHNSSTVVRSVEVRIIVLIVQLGTTLVYEPNPSNNYDFPYFDQPPQYHLDNSQQFDCCEHCRGPHYGSDCQAGDVTTLKRENDEFIKSSVDDLVPIPRESEVTSVYDDLKCDMPVNTPFPTTDVREENFDIASRRICSQLFNGKRGCDDSKSISYDVTLSNPLFDFNDDSTLCYDNPLFDEELEDINIDLLLGEPLDLLLMGDREIDFNPTRDIEELERLLADDPIPVPRVFDEPLGNSDSMSSSSETSDLFEKLITEFGLDDSTPIEINDRYHDSEGDILYFEQLLNEDTSSDVSPTLLPTESSPLVTPLPDPRQICLKEVERFDPFFSLTQSEGTTRVMETPSFGFHHIPSPCSTAYSPKVMMYCYYHPHLTSGDGFDHEPKMK